MSLPGLKRYCESTGRYRKLIIETSDSQIAAKMFLRANGIDGITEIRVIKKEVDPCLSVSSEVPEQIVPVVVSPKESPEVTPVSPRVVSSPSPQPKSRKDGLRKLPVLSDEERARRSERMKSMLAKRRESNATRTK